MIKKNKKQQEYKEYTDSEKLQIENDYNRTKQSFQVKPDFEPKIQNIVSTVQLIITETEKLNLDFIASKCSNCEYKKSRFPALIMRIIEPKSTALIFEAGKMVITGTKSIKESEQAAQKFVSKIEKTTKLKIKIEKIQTSNIVANSQLTYRVNLTNLNDDKGFTGSIQYEKSCFPGLIYQIVDPQLAALIFFSGKVVFTGAKNEHQIKKAYNYLLTVLHKHKQVENDIPPNKKQ